MSTANRNDPLLAELTGADCARRASAIDAILSAPATRLWEPVLMALVRCLGAQRKSVRRRGADALAAIAAHGDARVIESLRHSLSSADRRIRWGSAYALGLIGAGALATDSSGRLVDVSDALLEALSDDDGDVRWAATELIVGLGRINPNAIRGRLLELAVRIDGNRHSRKMALYCIRGLGLGGRDVINAVESAIGDADAYVRLAALAVLSRMIGDSSDDAARLLLRCLQTDTDAGVRRAAAAALGAIGGGSAQTLDALRAAQRDASDASMQRAARGALDRLEKR